jgi:hypothetical protein
MTYAHLSAAHKRAAVDALDGLTPSMKPREMASEMASKSESRPSLHLTLQIRTLPCVRA